MVNSFNFQLVYDTVSPKREVNPDRGLRIGLQTETAGKALASDYDFQRITGYIYGYLPLFESYLKPRARELILALRLQGGQSRGDVPFFYERGLGGHALRGVSGNRFVDRITAFWGAELRYTFTRLKFKKDSVGIYAMAFFDQGRTAHSKSDLGAKDFHEAAGVGIGTVAGENTVIEFVVGTSQFESYFELSVGHTFKAY